MVDDGKGEKNWRESEQEKTPDDHQDNLQKGSTPKDLRNQKKESHGLLEINRIKRTKSLDRRQKKVPI